MRVLALICVNDAEIRACLLSAKLRQTKGFCAATVYDLTYI